MDGEQRMTDPTPAQDEAEARENARARLAGDIQFGGTVQDGWYGDKAGPGRWFLLSMHDDPLGYVWTNDDDGLGFWPTTDAGRLHTPDLVLAFRQAKHQDATASIVFDYYSDLATLGLQAGPVQEGDLETLG